ncbi:MAG: hypothetical protein A3J85_05385 [Desulfobacula sp. RIFOXYA12_FULL_46_16]|nr:MAG: hypothetical protein A2464_03965 [Deltaproteobacteria bacterium RIFOXYC2_FULL_48_10]OGR21968.1 MAG: hypothetical protein A3J85_05385 [Desulfobacula sp. RIFOXYA12_FULL_46_16]
MKFSGIAVTLLTGIFFLSGCMVIVPDDHGRDEPRPYKTYHKPGPPPHAPAHGYRHKHPDGHELEYDSGLGVYIVVRVPDTYFENNLYIRMSSDGRWLVSASLDRGWHPASGNEIPYKLKKHKDKHKDKYKKNKKSHDD